MTIVRWIVFMCLSVSIGFMVNAFLDPVASGTPNCVKEEFTQWRSGSFIIEHVLTNRSPIIGIVHENWGPTYYYDFGRYPGGRTTQEPCTSLRKLFPLDLVITSATLLFIWVLMLLFRRQQAHVSEKITWNRRLAIEKTYIIVIGVLLSGSILGLAFGFNVRWFLLLSCIELAAILVGLLMRSSWVLYFLWGSVGITLAGLISPLSFFEVRDGVIAATPWYPLTHIAAGIGSPAGIGILFLVPLVFVAWYYLVQRKRTPVVRRTEATE